MFINQKTLRKTLRKQRLALTSCQQKLASYHAFRQLSHLPITLPKNAKIGIYLDAFGEMPVQPIIEWATRYRYQMYLPVVIGKNKPLKFCKMPSYTTKNWRLIKHSLGMKQPADLRQAIPARQLDILFMPLVAVDKLGYRMGMGGGFYDRTLADSKTKPIKIGWAYDFQMIEKLDTNPWDVPLDFAIFPNELKKFRRHSLDFSPPCIEKFETNEALSHELITQVMAIERLEDLLYRANAFARVNSEALDDF